MLPSVCLRGQPPLGEAESSQLQTCVKCTTGSAVSLVCVCLSVGQPWGLWTCQDTGLNCWPEGEVKVGLQQSGSLPCTLEKQLPTQNHSSNIPTSIFILHTAKTRGSTGEWRLHYFFFYYCYLCLSFSEEPCRTENLCLSLCLSLSLQHWAFLFLSYLYFLLLYLLWHVVTIIIRISFLFYVFFKR